MLINNYDAVGAIRVTEADGKVIKQTIKYTAKEPDYALAYAPTSFRVYNRKYTFHFPLRCAFEQTLKTTFVIACELLNIYAEGDTPADAEKNFSYKFHQLYEATRNDADAEAQRQKTIIDAHVKTIAQW